MNLVMLLFGIINISAGMLLAMYGEKDDSPGAFLLGLLVVASGIFLIFKYLKERSKK